MLIGVVWDVTLYLGSCDFDDSCLFRNTSLINDDT